jgi:Icc-related predicted phosphoesterase
MNPHCKAFTVDTEEKLAAKWALIPDDIDILITHSPQYGMLDYIHNYNTGRVDHLGSKTLMKKTADLTNLQLHVYGHIHETYGTEKILFRLGPPAEYREICVNASHVNERYEPVNAPIRVIL